GLLTLSLNFQAGFGGLINFGQIALFGCGTYGAGLAFYHGMNWPAGLAFSLALGGSVGWLYACLGRHLGADYWAIATLSVAEIFRIIANNEEWLTGSAQGIAGIPQFFAGLPRFNQLLALLFLA